MSVHLSAGIAHLLAKAKVFLSLMLLVQKEELLHKLSVLLFQSVQRVILPRNLEGRRVAHQTRPQS